MSTLSRTIIAVAFVALTAAACGEDAERSVASSTTSAVTTTTTASAGDDPSPQPGSGTYEEDPQPGETTTTQPPGDTQTDDKEGDVVASDESGLEYGGGDEAVAGQEPLNATPVEPEEAPWIVAAATTDLARRTGAAEGDIAVVSVEAVVWRDGSLGCPQPGMAYTQVLTDGARITLEHNGTSYVYHSGGDREPFLCQKRS